MKIFLIALAMLAFVVTPAYADNSEEVIIGVMGGLLGGLIVGEIIDRDHHHVYVERKPIRKHRLRHCTTYWVEYFDEYYGHWVTEPRQKCR